MKVSYMGLIALLSCASVVAADCVTPPVRYRSYARTQAKPRPAYATAAQIAKVNVLPASALPANKITPPIKATTAASRKTANKTMLSAAEPEVYIRHDRWDFYSYP